MVSLIDLFTQVSVKIHCCDDVDEENGTGTLISDGEKFYVITAGHCVKKESNDQPFNHSDIEITSFAGKTPQQITVTAPITRYDFAEKMDFAVIEIEKPEVEIKLVENVKRCDTQLDEETYYFYGYSEPNEQGRLYIVRRTGKNQWHLCDDSITNQDLGAYQLMGVNSGAGVFFEKTGILYHIGYVKRMIDESGTQSDLIVYPTCNFDDVLPESTKESNLFELVEKWKELKRKEISDELMEYYKKHHQEYMGNLSRKMNVLYPNGKEASERERTQLGNFIRGLELTAEINKTSAIARTLRDRENDLFEAFCEDRSEYVEDKEARDDMGKIKKQIKELADEVLDLHDRDKSVARGYADYSIAEKLLECSLDYKKENDDK